MREEQSHLKQIDNVLGKLKTFLKMFLEFLQLHIKVTLNLTQCEFLPRVRWKSESKESHGGDEHARDNQVEEVVQGSTPDE